MPLFTTSCFLLFFSVTFGDFFDFDVFFTLSACLSFSALSSLVGSSAFFPITSASFDLLPFLFLVFLNIDLISLPSFFLAASSSAFSLSSLIVISSIDFRTASLSQTFSTAFCEASIFRKSMVEIKQVALLDIRLTTFHRQSTFLKR